MKNILIKKKVEAEVSSVLTDGKVLLQFAIASVIEVFGRNPDKYNTLLHYNMPSASSSPTQQLPSMHIEGYNDMVLDEAKRLYDKLLKYFTNTIMKSLVSLLLHPMPHYRRRNHHHLHSQSYRIKLIYTV